MNLFSGAKIWCPLSVLERVRITEGFFFAENKPIRTRLQTFSILVENGREGGYVIRDRAPMPNYN